MSESSGASYSAAVAEIYDLLMGGPEAARDVAHSCRDYVTGQRVLDVGSGSASVAVELCAYAESVVGIDNSPEMIRVAQTKALPPNLELLLVDFREDLPFPSLFSAAVSTRGSLACVGNRDELRSAISGIRRVLKLGSPLFVEYYSRTVYEEFVKMGVVPFELDEGSWRGDTAGRLDGDVLSMSTTLVHADGRVVDFRESVLLLDQTELTAIFADCGFSFRRHADVVYGSPFDGYVFVAS